MDYFSSDISENYETNLKNDQHALSYALSPLNHSPVLSMEDI